MRGQARRSDAGQNYFISFNDLLVGMLFIFIILLVTFALTFRKAEQQLTSRLDRLEQRMKQREDLLLRLQANLRRQGVESKIDPDQGVLRLAENVLFRPGEATLDGRAQRALGVLARELARELPCYGRGYSGGRCRHGGGPILEALYIEGHTDSVPIHNSRFRSNWELSSARAIVTYNQLAKAEGGVLARQPNASGTATLLGASAYADTRPIPEARSPGENRRTDFRFLLAPASRAEIEQALEQ
jgi:flagellar motor protein MotB